MKKRNTRHIRRANIQPRRYPNAADSRYYLDRLSDILLSAATICGAVTVFIFLFAAT